MDCLPGTQTSAAALIIQLRQSLPATEKATRTLSEHHLSPCFHGNMPCFFQPVPTGEQVMSSGSSSWKAGALVPMTKNPAPKNPTAVRFYPLYTPWGASYVWVRTPELPEKAEWVEKQPLFSSLRSKRGTSHHCNSGSSTVFRAISLCTEC